MRYPIRSATTIPGSGNAFYLFLIENTHISAKLTHELWYQGRESLKNMPDNSFQGFFPIGETLKLSYAGGPMQDYTFSGEEKNSVYVKDLSIEAMLTLGISSKSKVSDKVFNPLFRPYEELPESIIRDNELPTLSLAKSIVSFLSSRDVLFTEKSIVEMLTVAVQNTNSQEMRHILHGNHIAWCTARFMVSGLMEQDIKKNFYGQNEIDFYIKDIATIMPSILFSFASLGIDPLVVINWLDYSLYGIKTVANQMQKCMLTYKDTFF